MRHFILDLHHFVKCPKCGEEIELLQDNTYFVDKSYFKEGKGKPLPNIPSSSQHSEYSENHSLDEEEQALQS